MRAFHPTAKHRPLYRSFLQGLIATAFAFFHSNAVAQDAAIPEPSDQVKIQKTVVNGFVHPGIGLTKEILENARAQVLAKKEPWYSGYQKLCSDRYSSKTTRARNQSYKNPAEPDSDALDSQGMEMRLSQDSGKAYNQALMYYFTGQDVYRANALTILRVWSRMDPAKCKPYRDANIHAGYPLKSMITAAEILRCTSCTNRDLTWTPQDDRLFINNLVAPAITKLMNSNGWFMNQNNFAIIGAMAGFIYTNDRERYNERVEWFTVNKTAPNQGWNGSIKQLARLVDTNAQTGEKVAKPVVQLVEMGRDQAHGGEDVNLFVNLSRMMMAQGTRVDPVAGTVSKKENAVGPYEFLDDRILAAADYFCRYMLGYDTPWISVAHNIGPKGEINGIYPRLSDQYRGRMTTFGFWDLHFYYTFVKGIKLSDRAPYLAEAFSKRVTPLDWIFIPKEGAGMPLEQNPAIAGRVEIETRCTLLSPNATTASDDEASYVRLAACPEGTRVVLLSSATRSNTFGLRIRTNGPAELDLSGFAKPWHLPDTSGEWAHVTYTAGPFEAFGDIVYFSAKGQSGTTIDLDCFLPDLKGTLTPPAFKSGGDSMRVVTFVGAPVTLDLSASDPAPADRLIYVSKDKPADATLTSDQGAFSWKPTQAGESAFVLSVTDGETITSKKISIFVAPDRMSAVQEILRARESNTEYVKATLEQLDSVQRSVVEQIKTASDAKFQELLIELQRAASSLEVLTPRLADGSMDFTKVVRDSDIGGAIGLLIDGNDDTFPVFTLAKDLNYQFDFGPDFKFSAEAFELEGRLNFEDRTRDTLFYGSDDKKKWVQLTAKATEQSTDKVRVEVIPSLAQSKFRYLSIQKVSKKGLLEASELRIFGQRYESGN
jgi:large repetitive protein